MFKYELMGDNDYIFDIVGSISANRGVESLYDYLNVKDDVIEDWRILKNIHKARDIIVKHVESNSKIHIVVDTDADGYTSAAIIYQYLKTINEDLQITYHIHNKKVHGIKEVSHELDIDLLIIPDSSSDEAEEHKRFHDKGVDVVILDHHELENGESKYATTVNPQLDKVGNLSLSGAGIVYKMCQALDEYYDEDLADYFLDLVAIGNIADMMSLKNLETRCLINKGLENINNSFLHALIDKQSYSMKGKVNPTTIGFYVSPLINAVTRIGTYEERVDLFKAFIEHKELVEYKSSKKKEPELVPFVSDFARQCTNIKSRQNRNKDKKVDELLLSINEEDLTSNKAIFISDMNVDNGTKGLIANQISNKYMKPSIIVDFNKKEGMYTGSGRSYGGFDELKDLLNSSEYVEYAKGHGSAFGIAIKKEDIEKFKETLNELLSNVEFENKYKIDFLIPLKSFTPYIIDEICELSEVWGRELDEPKIVVNDFKISDVNFEVIGSKLDTIQMKRGKITYIAFRQKQEDIVKIRDANEIDIVGKCSVNEYKGQKQYQFVIDDINIIK